MADPIELYLIRHGLAEERGDAWPDDSKRPLSTKGVARLRRTLAALSTLGVTFDQVLTSPFVRTRQTAEILAQAGKAPIVSTSALAPGGTAAHTIEELGRYGTRKRIALIGHEPDIGELAARLLGVRAPLEFKKGGICRIDVETLPPARGGHLRWFATPKLLRAIGRKR
jgi:phosphohistidine phosphatase